MVFTVWTDKQYEGNTEEENDGYVISPPKIFGFDNTVFNDYISLHFLLLLKYAQEEGDNKNKLLEI